MSKNEKATTYKIVCEAAECIPVCIDSFCPYIHFNHWNVFRDESFQNSFLLKEDAENFVKKRTDREKRMKEFREKSSFMSASLPNT